MQRTTSVFAVSLFLLGAAGSAQAQGSPREYGYEGSDVERPQSLWYVGASFGLANASYSSRDLESQLDAAGFPGVTSDTDDEEFGYQFYGGYRVRRNIAFELGFADLGEIDSTLSIPVGTDETALFDEVERVHESSGFGATLAVKVSAYQHRGWDLWGKVGGFLWWSDSEIQGPTQRRGFDDNGFDLLLGVGATYRFEDNWAVQAEVDGFRINGEWVEFYSLGLQYLFLTRDDPRYSTPN